MTVIDVMRKKLSSKTIEELMDLARYFNDKTEQEEIIVAVAIDSELSNRLDDVTFMVFMEELESAL